MTLAILKMSGKIPLWSDSTKGESMMSFNCFIIFVGKLLGPVLVLAFRSDFSSFISSMVVGAIKRVRLFGLYKKLEKWFL